MVLVKEEKKRNRACEGDPNLYPRLLRFGGSTYTILQPGRGVRRECRERQVQSSGESPGNRCATNTRVEIAAMVLPRSLPPYKMMFDVAIYGSTSGAVAAAIQSARSGRSVALISPQLHIGKFCVVGQLGRLHRSIFVSLSHLIHTSWHRAPGHSNSYSSYSC